MCVLIFSTTFFKKFSFLEELSEILSKMYIRIHVKYLLFLSEFNKNLIFFDRFSKNSPNIKFHENPSSGSRVVPCGQTDGLTDMAKLIVAFRSFANAPKNGTSNKQNKNHQYDNNNNNVIIVVVVVFPLCLVDQAALSRFSFVSHAFLMSNYTSTDIM